MKECSSDDFFKCEYSDVCGNCNYKLTCAYQLPKELIPNLRICYSGTTKYYFHKWIVIDGTLFAVIENVKTGNIDRVLAYELTFKEPKND